MFCFFLKSKKQIYLIFEFQNWNDKLAKFAETTASKCIFGHSAKKERTKLAGFGYVGENVYAGVNKPEKMERVVDAWGSEIQDYDLQTNKCKGVCGHYTQVSELNNISLRIVHLVLRILERLFEHVAQRCDRKVYGRSVMWKWTSYCIMLRFTRDVTN